MFVLYYVGDVGLGSNNNMFSMIKTQFNQPIPICKGFTNNRCAFFSIETEEPNRVYQRRRSRSRSSRASQEHASTAASKRRCSAPQVVSWSSRVEGNLCVRVDAPDDDDDDVAVAFCGGGRIITAVI